MTNVIFIRVYSMTSSICFSKQSWEGSQREGTANYDPHYFSFLAVLILIYTVKSYKQFTCFKIRYSFRSIKQFGNVTKFLLGQPLGHVKRGSQERAGSRGPLRLNLS